MGLIAPAVAPIWSLLRAVPLWAWALCAALAWGGWQRHQARSAAQDLAAVQLQAARQREAALAAAALQQARIATEQGAIADETRQRLDRARADARRAADHAHRLRQQLAAGAAAAASAAAAGDCAPAAAAAGVHAQLLDRAVDRARVLAEHADQAAAAGAACERSYDALTER